MGGYIGARSGTISATVANVQDVTATDSTPEVTIVNNTHEDTDGGREGKVIFKGQQSGGEESTLAEIQASHDGTADDEKGDLIFRTNDGSDGASPTERVRIDSNGSILTATLGTDNVHLGEGAGASIVSGGKYNTLIGKDAGTALTTGDNNVAVGYGALSTEDANGRNTAIGLEALTTLNAGVDGENVAVGYRAGKAMTTGIQNTLIGTQAGDALTDADYNVAVGRNALSNDTQGHRSTAIGFSALNSQNFTSSTASQNTAVGYGAGTDLTTAVNSTFLGADAGANVTTGNKNTMVGDGAGVHVTTGASNSILGRYSGNAGGLDMRTANNNIVLSDGDGNVRAYWGHVTNSGNQHWYLQSDISQWTTAVKNTHSSAPYGLLIQYSSAAPNGNSNEFLFCYDGANNEKMSVRSSGDVKNANNSYGAVSDLKLKENIADANSQWDDIKAVKVKKYSMKIDESDTANRIGVIAQDLEAAGMNGLVDEDVDRDADRNDLGTTPKSVKYSVLYMKAIKALQEAMTRIETLETKVAALEAE